jgi:hypothetical protein
MALKSKPLDQVRKSVPNVQLQPDEIVRINLNVPKSIRTKWKAIANDRDMTVTDLIIEAVSKYSNE